MNDKHLKFIDVYLNSKSIAETCKELDISRQTAYIYLSQPEVKNEINQRRGEILTNTTTFLQNQLINCSSVLVSIINDDKISAQVKVNAVNSIFNNFNKLLETTDIITRLNEIEKRLNETSD